MSKQKRTVASFAQNSRRCWPGRHLRRNSALHLRSYTSDSRSSEPHLGVDDHGQVGVFVGTPLHGFIVSPRNALRAANSTDNVRIGHVRQRDCAKGC